MKDLFYTQIAEIIIIAIIYSNDKYNFLTKDIEKYLFIGMSVGIIYTIIKLRKIILKNKNAK